MDSALLRSGVASPMAFAVTALLFMLMAALVARPPANGASGETLPTIIFGPEFVSVIEPAKPPEPPKPPIVQAPEVPTAPTSDFTPEIDRSPGLDLAPGAEGLPIPGPILPRSNTMSSDAALLPTVRLGPRYPRRAALAGIEGEVLVEFTVTRTGQVVNPRVIEATPRGVFERAALAAIVRWRFEPRRVGGEPLESRARQLLEFRLAE